MYSEGVRVDDVNICKDPCTRSIGRGGCLFFGTGKQSRSAIIAEKLMLCGGGRGAVVHNVLVKAVRSPIRHTLENFYLFPQQAICPYAAQNAKFLISSLKLLRFESLPYGNK